MKGIGIAADENSNYGTYQDITGSPGQYEFLIVDTAFSATKTIQFRKPLLNDYDINSFVQVIRVPTYFKATVVSSLSCPPWNAASGTGGVLSMIINDTLTLNADINVSGEGNAGALPALGNGICAETPGYNNYAYDASYNNSGFKGEGSVTIGWTSVPVLTPNPIYPAYAKGYGNNFDGGGGGNGRFSGGAGGSNIGNGGRGGQEFKGTCISQKLGGHAGYSDSTGVYNGIFLGGGGGGSTYSGSGVSSPGGNGGGIVIIMCKTLAGEGHSILANGLAPSINASDSAGAGGGGAGGSIAIYLEQFNDSLKLFVTGGKGGNNSYKYGEGGGGGGGLIWTSVGLPGFVKPNVTPGARGTLLGGGSAYSNPGGSGISRSSFAPVLNGFLFNSIRTSFKYDSIDYICSNKVPNKISGTTPVGGTTPYTIKWQLKNTSPDSLWRDIATGSLPALKDYIFNVPQPDTFKIRRIVIDSTIPTNLKDTSNTVRIIVHSEILNNNIRIFSADTSLSDTVCLQQVPGVMKQKPKVSINDTLWYPTTDSLYFFWQDSTQKAGRHWRTFFSGPGASVYTPSAGLDSTKWYRRALKSGVCVNSSDSIFVKVLQPITGNAISAAQEICSGSKFDTLRPAGVLANGDTKYRFQWLLRKGASGSFLTTSVTDTSKTYFPPAETNDTLVNNYYRRVVYSGTHDVCRDTSNLLLLTQLKNISNNSLASVLDSVCSGLSPQIITGSQPADGSSGNYLYDWQKSTDSVLFSDAGGTSKDYQPPALTVKTWYRRSVTSSACSSISDTMKIRVDQTILNNTVFFNNPVNPDTTVCYNQLTLPINAQNTTGGTNIPLQNKYYWEIQYPGKSNWVTAPAPFNTKTYQPALFDTVSPISVIYNYRRNFTSGACSSVSNTAAVTEFPAIAHSNDLISTPDTAVCYNTSPGTINAAPLTGGDPNTLTTKWLWQQSTNGGASWNTAAPAYNTQNYAPPSLIAVTEYRRLVSSGPNGECKDTTVNIQNISINPRPSSTIGSPDYTICEGDSKKVGIQIINSTAFPFTLILRQTNTLDNSYTLLASNSTSLTNDSIPLTPSIPGNTTSNAIYKYSVESLSDANLCLDTTRAGSSLFTVYKVPSASNANIDAGSDKSVCGPKAQLEGTANFGIGTWTYPLVPVTVPPSTATNDTVTINFLSTNNSEKYRFYWTVLNVICSGEDSVDITFYQDPGKANAGPPQHLFSPVGTDTLHAVKPAFGDGKWSVVSGGATFINDTVVSHLSAGNNVFLWTVTNGNCSSSDQMSIDFQDIKRPTAFSPNGDKWNNEFEIVGLDTVNYEVTIKILNSAGSQVYHSDNLNGNEYKQWNGENEKGPLPDGTYYYVLSVVLKSDHSVKFYYQGFILVKRDKN
jgi:gliding motility-associated-like protein